MHNSSNSLVEDLPNVFTPLNDIFIINPMFDNTIKPIYEVLYLNDTPINHNNIFRSLHKE